jgi:general secretion pathway protein G
MRTKGQGIRDKGQGFTLVELATVTCITVVLILTFLNRVLFYQEQVERAAMIGLVTGVQSSLNMQQMGFLLRNEETKIAALATENPVNFLDEKPLNYAGEFFDPAPDAIAPGNWAFDLKSREMIYVPDHARHISFTGEGQKWIRYQVKLIQGITKEASGKGNLASVTFEPVIPYRWEI